MEEHWISLKMVPVAIVINVSMELQHQQENMYEILLLYARLSLQVVYC